ncbi:MAG TPA: WbuC family cupin fold metalloprotein [Bryobacteraceae bacterium]|jgi:cupin fold WbuC family metalloprotein
MTFLARYHENVTASDVQILDQDLIDRLIVRARQSPRLRTNHNFHPTLDDNPHRFLNVMIRGTYITPHRHIDPPKSESFLLLRGEVAFFIFNDLGAITRTEILGRNQLAIDIAPGIWHTLAVLTPVAVCYEVKPGPYTAASDKDFAPWAPREGDPQAPDYLQSLLAAR